MAPAILQPADLLLDRAGEAIRSRTYVFTDADGNELCLRPDLTIPVARIYLDRHPEADVEALYCYNGPAFRYQYGKPDPLRPREFRQAGIESYGCADALKADIEVLCLTLDAVRQAGLKSMTLKLGDNGLFDGLLHALPMPERWRTRLAHSFSRTDAFRKLLQQLSAPRAAEAAHPLDKLLDALESASPAAAELLVGEHLETSGITHIGTRTLAEITARLTSRAADRTQPPLPREIAATIEQYLAISGPAPAALERIAQLTSAAGLDLTPQLAAFEARLKQMSALGCCGIDMPFSAKLGQRFEYYTGFVFEISAPDGGIPAPFASGGRYDKLLGSIGAPRGVPAVGAAIYTERLLAAVAREAS